MSPNKIILSVSKCSVMSFSCYTTTTHGGNTILNGVIRSVKPNTVHILAGCSFDEERDVAPWQERSLMVRWVDGSILDGVDPLSYFSFQPVLHDWCDKDRGMYYPVYIYKNPCC